GAASWSPASFFCLAGRQLAAQRTGRLRSGRDSLDAERSFPVGRAGEAVDSKRSLVLPVFCRGLSSKKPSEAPIAGVCAGSAHARRSADNPRGKPSPSANLRPPGGAFLRHCKEPRSGEGARSARCRAPAPETRGAYSAAACLLAYEGRLLAEAEPAARGSGVRVAVSK